MNIPVLLFLLILPFVSPPGETPDRAVQYYEKGEYREAVDLLSSAADNGDVSAEMKFWLGKSLLKIRKWDRAVRELERAVQMEPSNALFHLWLGRAYGARAEHRIFGFNDARRVIKQFKKARELDPDSITIRFDLLEFYAQAPGIVGGGKDKAWEEAEAISKLNPMRGHTARATIYEREKKWDLALEELKQAAARYPNDADVHKDLARFLFDREDYEGALAGARKALELNCRSRRSLLITAASYIQLGRHLEKAREILLNLASGPLGDEAPSFEEVYYWLGVYYFKNGEMKKSKESFASALAYNPDYEKARDFLSKFN